MHYWRLSDGVITRDEVFGLMFENRRHCSNLILVAKEAARVRVTNLEVV